MKKFLIFVILFSGGGSALAKDLYVIKKDGSSVIFDTDELLEIGFEKGSSDVVRWNSIDSIRNSNDSLQSIIDELRDELFDCQKSQISDLFFLQQIESHRGVCGIYPENTLTGFKAAVEKGYYLLEGDVCQTADQNFVLLHDLTINRTSNGSGTVSNMTLEQLRQYDYGYQSKYGNTYAGTEIPTIEDVLGLCKETKTLFEFDIAGKNVDYELIVNKVAAMKMLDRVMFKCTVAQAPKILDLNIPVVLGISGSVGTTPISAIN